MGSGYPSDPTTRTFLADYVDRHGELPACARRSWSTCDDVLAAASQSTLRTLSVVNSRRNYRRSQSASDEME